MNDTQNKTSHRYENRNCNKCTIKHHLTNMLMSYHIISYSQSRSVYALFTSRNKGKTTKYI